MKIKDIASYGELRLRLGSQKGDKLLLADAEKASAIGTRQAELDGEIRRLKDESKQLAEQLIVDAPKVVQDLAIKAIEHGRSVKQFYLDAPNLDLGDYELPFDEEGLPYNMALYRLPDTDSFAERKRLARAKAKADNRKRLGSTISFLQRVDNDEVANAEVTKNRIETSKSGRSRKVITEVTVTQDKAKPASEFFADLAKKAADAIADIESESESNPS